MRSYHVNTSIKRQILVNVEGTIETADINC